jgi:ATP-dependent RNA helicase DHX29
MFPYSDFAKISLLGDSDLLTMYNAYSAWRKICSTAGGSDQHFCRKNYLSSQSLSNIEELKAQLMTSIVDAGFVILNEAEKSLLNR